jgi:tetratricopeptide (TPR) repeat protein
MVAIACGYFVFAWTIGHSRSVWVVNGLDHDYDVSINGKPYHLLAHDARPINIAEGHVLLASASVATPFPEQSIRLTTPLLTRPFIKPTFIINPDKTALVYEEVTLFSHQAPKTLEEMDHHHLFVGDALYQFADVDYPFNEFPDSVGGADGASSVRKKKVALWTLGSPAQQTHLVEKEAGHDASMAFAKQLAICNPDRQSALMLLANLMPREKMVAFLRSRLDCRPVQVTWHRTYQMLIQQADPSYDLQAEYRARLKTEPADCALMYLLARLIPDRAESEQWLKKSTRGTYPCGYGFFALAYRALSCGNFDDALLMAQEAVALLPGNSDAQAAEAEALAALGRYNQLLDRARKDQARAPLDPLPVLREIHVLALQGKLDQARRVTTAFVARASTPGNARMIQNFKSNAESVSEYASGNLARFVMANERNPGAAQERFQADLSQDRLDEAAADLSNNPTAAAGDHLLLATAAMDAGREDLATRHLQLSASGYRMGDADMQLVAKWLCQEELPDPENVCQVALMPDQKRLVLTALGLRDPAHRERYFKAAVNLNYDRAFPYLTVKRVLDGPLVALR